MEKYKINGNPISMPTGWHDVKYNKAIEIIGEDDELIIFSKLSGLDIKDVRAVDDGETIAYFLSSFRFVFDLPNESQMPLSIKVGDELLPLPTVVYEDPNDLGRISFGQVADMKELFVKKVNATEKLTKLDEIELMPDIVAIYLQPIINKEYDFNKAMKLSERIKEEMSFKDICSMGSFFLQRLAVFMSGLKTSYRSPNWIARKWKQALRKLTRFLVLRGL